MLQFTSPNCLAFSCASKLGEILIFEYRSSTQVQSIRLPQGLCSLVTAPQHHRLLAGGERGTVYLINMDTCDWTELHGHAGAVQCAAFLQQDLGMLTASGSTVMRWKSLLS
jgi:WD40 repeat protein